MNDPVGYYGRFVIENKGPMEGVGVCDQCQNNQYRHMKGRAEKELGHAFFGKIAIIAMLETFFHINSLPQRIAQRCHKNRQKQLILQHHLLMQAMEEA